jgi:Arc/MetJ-type ribon-helix-helix transcriptional regulator
MDTPLPPSLRRFIDRQIKNGRFQNPGDVINAALQRMEVADGLAGAPADFAVLGDLNGADIEAVAFLVLMEAAKSAQEDLKAIMAEVKAMTRAKTKLRDLINKVNREVAANAGCDDGDRKLDYSRGLGNEQAYHRAPMPVLDPDAVGGVRLKPCDLHRGRSKATISSS